MFGVGLAKLLSSNIAETLGTGLQTPARLVLYLSLYGWTELQTLSRLNDEGLLNDPAFLMQAGGGIAKAIKDFIEQQSN